MMDTPIRSITAETVMSKNGQGIAALQEYKKIRKNYDRDSLDKKADLIEQITSKKLAHIRACSYNPESFQNNIENPLGIIQIPLGLSGPIWVEGKNANGEFFIPMATTEGALLLTYDLGMRLLRLSGPIHTEVISKVMHLDPMFLIVSELEKQLVEKFVFDNFDRLKSIAESKSTHTTLLGIEPKLIKRSLVLNCTYDTGDAHGLNMINEATFNMCEFISASTGVKYYHRSHYSAVKHHSTRNEVEGYGKKVKAHAIISEKALRMIGVTAFEMKDFTDRCVDCGAAAGVSAINVHASNGITAITLATGQDMADISSSHVCKASCEVVNSGDLYYEVILPNLLVATVGGGTGLGTQKECLEIMDCFGSNKADKFAELIAASVLAGEFPTAAAVVNKTYVDIHNKYGRNKTQKLI